MSDENIFLTELVGILSKERKAPRKKKGISYAGSVDEIDDPRVPKEKKPKVSGQKKSPKKPKLVSSVDEVVVSPEHAGDPCERCPNNQQTKCLSGIGNPDAGLLIVFDHVNPSRMGNQNYLSEKEEKFLADLEKWGIDLGDVYLTNTFRCFSNRGDEQTQTCLYHLRSEIIKPTTKVIVLMGLDPFRTLLKKDAKSLFQWKGQLFTLQDVPTLVTWDPDQYLGNPDRDRWVEMTFKKAWRIRQGLYGSAYKPNYILPKTWEEVIDGLSTMLSEITPTTLVYLDVESMYTEAHSQWSLEPYHPEFHVWHIGLSWGDYRGISFPFDTPTFLQEKFGLLNWDEHGDELREFLQHIFDTYEIGTHTGFDAKALGYRYGFKIPRIRDAQLEQYACDDTAGQARVEELADIYEEDGDYKYKFVKPQGLEDYDWDYMANYNAHDADIERRIYYKLSAEVDRVGVRNAYDLLTLQNRCGIKMTLNGFYMNPETLSANIKIEVDKRDPLLTEWWGNPLLKNLHEYVESHKKEKSVFGKVASFDDLTITKDWVVEHLLYDICGFKPPKQTEKGERSTDEESLEILEKDTTHSEAHRRLPRLVLEIRKINKKLSTYLTCYPEDTFTKEGKITKHRFLKLDGLVHSDFNFHIARSGRSSSSNPNLQNIVNDLLIKAMFAARPRPGQKSFLLASDFKQHEIRMCAHQCLDEAMIAAIAFDFHSLNLGIQEKLLLPIEIRTITKERETKLIDDIQKRYLRVLCPGILDDVWDFPFEEIQDFLKEVGEASVPGNPANPTGKSLLANWKNYFKKKRTVAKESTFGPLYGMMPPSFAAANSITIPEAEEIYRMDRLAYPKKHEFFAGVKEFAKEHNYVEGCTGKRRRLDYRSAGKSSYKLAELDRQAVNTKIQGPASDIGVMAMYKCMEAFEQEGLDAFGIATVHDSLMHDVAEKDIERAGQITRWAMEEYPITWLGENPVKFEGDYEIGTNWADLKAWNP